MQEIKDLKTRDQDILCETIREIADLPKTGNAWDLSVMTDIIKSFPCQFYITYCRELKQWVFTDLMDDDLVFQEYFRDLNFVIVESDLLLALARGIHYRFHKKVRP